MPDTAGSGRTRRIKGTYIKTDEHVFIAGKNGSGKTYTAKILLQNNPLPVHVLDIKGTFNWDELPAEMIGIYTDLESFKAGEQYYRIYRPNFMELTEEFYNEFFRYCYELGNNTVVVDEAMAVSQNSQTIPIYYAGILQRGRELNVNVWSLAQRPSGIHQLLLSESTHYFIFLLTIEMDRKKLVTYTGEETFYKPAPYFQCWYWNAKLDQEPTLIQYVK